MNSRFTPFRSAAAETRVSDRNKLKEAPPDSMLVDQRRQPLVGAPLARHVAANSLRREATAPARMDRRDARPAVGGASGRRSHASPGGRQARHSTK